MRIYPECMERDPNTQLCEQIGFSDADMTAGCRHYFQ